MVKILATLAGANFSASPTHSRRSLRRSVCHGSPRKVEDGMTNAEN
jgi:hypothetical protein